MNDKERITILRGSFEESIYKKQELNEYDYNPFIEALPRIFNEEEVIDRFTGFTDIKDEDRCRSNNLRYHIIKRVKDFIQPLPIHIIFRKKIIITY